LGGPAFVAPVVGVVGQCEAGFGVAGDGSVGGVLGTSESGTGSRAIAGPETAWLAQANPAMA
jgi:hypothetical protein